MADPRPCPAGVPESGSAYIAGKVCYALAVARSRQWAEDEALQPKSCRPQDTQDLARRLQTASVVKFEFRESFVYYYREAKVVMDAILIRLPRPCPWQAHRLASQPTHPLTLAKASRVAERRNDERIRLQRLNICFQRCEEALVSLVAQLPISLAAAGRSGGARPRPHSRWPDAAGQPRSSPHSSLLVWWSLEGTSSPNTVDAFWALFFSPCPVRSTGTVHSPGPHTRLSAKAGDQLGSMRTVLSSEMCCRQAPAGFQL